MFSQAIKKTQRHNLLASVWQSLSQFNSHRNDSGLCLHNKSILITGGGSGIGASAAIAFAKEGCNVAIADIDEHKLKRVAEYCEEKYYIKTLKLKTDVSKEEQLAPMICRTVQKFGKLDVVVNNAGIKSFGSILSRDLMKQYDRTLKINVRARLFITLLATPYLIETGGNIVNISSIYGSTYTGDSEYMPYSISHACLDHFTYGAALELANVGVRVNNVCPGPTKADIFSRGKKDKDVCKVDDASDPEEVADMIVYLASAKAKSITGVKFYIDKGILLKNRTFRQCK